MNYSDWVVNWFQENAGVDSAELQQHMDDNYFELGYIDSFAFIMLMGAVEEELGIVFDNDSFQDRSFSTINGFVHALEMQKK